MSNKTGVNHYISVDITQQEKLGPGSPNMVFLITVGFEGKTKNDVTFQIGPFPMLLIPHPERTYLEPCKESLLRLEQELEKLGWNRGVAFEYYLIILEMILEKLYLEHLNQKVERRLRARMIRTALSA